MKKEQETINVCERCKSPLISTFAFMGAELYCMNCNISMDMFGGVSIPITKELKKAQKTVMAEWKKLRVHLFTGGVRMEDCKKCFPPLGGGEYHSYHLIKMERKNQEKALQRLKDFTIKVDTN